MAPPLLLTTEARVASACVFNVPARLAGDSMNGQVAIRLESDVFVGATGATEALISTARRRVVRNSELYVTLDQGHRFLVRQISTCG